MATFKIKYCHKVFDILAVRQLCDALLHEAFVFYKIKCDELSFDFDHVHIIIDMGLYSKVELAKKIKGFIAKKLFKLMPWLKQQTFCGSGFWNPAYDIRSVNDIKFYRCYLDKQKYASARQKILGAY